MTGRAARMLEALLVIVGRLPDDDQFDMTRRTKRILRPLIGIGVCLAVGAPFVWRGLPGGASADARAAAGPDSHPAATGAPARRQRGDEARGRGTVKPKPKVAVAPRRRNWPPTTEPQMAAPLPPLAGVPQPLAVWSTLAAAAPTPAGAAPAVAFVPAPGVGVVNVPIRPWLPPAVGPRAGPRGGRPQAPDSRPASRATCRRWRLDLPGDVPQPVRVAGGATGRVAATAAGALFARPPETGPDPRRDVTRDPAAAQSIVAAHAADPPVRTDPGPFVRLAIPEPDEAEGRSSSARASPTPTRR